MTKKNNNYYLNKSLCMECGGFCCKNLPGCNVPSDFNEDKEVIKRKLESGKYTIDWWEGDPRFPKHDSLGRAFFIRPSIKGKEGKIKDPAWGGECTFLTLVGCSLSPDERPKECRLLEPREYNIREDSGCNSHGPDKQAASIEWLPYTEFLESLIEEFYDRNH